MCKCFSYNMQEGEVPNVILNPNDYFDWDSEARNVCVDACIAEQIKMLWENNIWTGGCCCGHGEYEPEVIIKDEINSDMAERAVELLKEYDPERNWKVYQWRLMNVEINTRYKHKRKNN